MSTDLAQRPRGHVAASAGHPLDRPVWNSLSTRQRELAIGDQAALRLAPAWGVFAAAADVSPDSLVALGRLNPPEGGLAVVEAEEGLLPSGPFAARRHPCVQMVAPVVRGRDPLFRIEPLGERDAAEMAALAALTEPGPWRERTHELGEFVGVKQAGRLVAMAGERMKLDGFTEVSGVCTHPDHRGRGYAGALMRAVASRILARGETPFLHAYADNHGAIQLYESLGFRTRRMMTMAVLAGAPIPDEVQSP